MGVLERYQPRCRIFLLDGKRFRTNLLTLFFHLPLKRETATKTALLAELLKRGCEAYPTPQALAKRAEEMYGALWDISVVKKGDRQLLLFSLETLKAVEMEEAVAFLRMLALRPLVVDDAFPEEQVERQKKILKRKLDALRDDKKGYARQRALEETAEGTAWAVSADGYEEDLAEINGKNLYAYYRHILEQAEVFVFFCGEKTERAKVLSLRKEFPGRVAAREWEPHVCDRHRPPHFTLERIEAEQTRLVLGFAPDTDSGGKQAVLLLLNQLLGGDPDSLLFQRVREEKGLCYDIKSYTYPLSSYLFVQAGIREEDAKETGKLVLKCMEEWKQRPVPEEKLRQAKESIRREFAGLADAPWAMVDFFADRALQGKGLTVEAFLRRIERVDAEEIARCAAHLRLKAVYMLSGREESHA